MLIGSDHNPADRGSRGCGVNQLSGEWLIVPDWLADLYQWPTPVVTKSSKESEAKAKQIKETMAIAGETEDSFDALLAKHPYWKTIRIDREIYP